MASSVIRRLLVVELGGWGALEQPHLCSHEMYTRNLSSNCVKYKKKRRSLYVSSYLWAGVSEIHVLRGILGVQYDTRAY